MTEIERIYKRNRKGEDAISSLYIKLIQYSLFTIFLLAGVSLFYYTVSTAQERRTHRLQLLNTFQKGKQLAQESFDNQSFKVRLEEAGLNFLTPLRYELFRLSLLFGLTVYYIVIPLLSGETITTTPISVIVYLGIITEHRLKNRMLSLINLLIDFLINKRKRQKEIEIFTLYDLLKAELNQLSDSKEVNVYSLLKDIAPMFNYIKRPFQRFLSLMMTDPDKAKYVFYEDIGTQGAKTIGELLIKIDSSGKNEALDLLKNESSVYHQLFYKAESEQQAKRKNSLMFWFSFNIFMSCLWLLVVITYVMMGQMGTPMTNH